MTTPCRRFPVFAYAFANVGFNVLATAFLFARVSVFCRVAVLLGAWLMNVFGDALMVRRRHS
jgi:hypothetical protein